jgi:DNA-binding IclR family transcriptional regulator
LAQTEKSGDGVRAVERALDILLALDSAEQFLSVGELLKRVDLSRPTLYRLLQTLEQKGFVVSSGNPQRFALGPSVGRLANLWTSRSGITPAAQPVMQRLWELTGETVSLLVHQGLQRVCLAEIASPQPLSFRRGHGYSEDVCKGASGRAILAFLDDPQTYLPDAMNPVFRQAFIQELARVREMGYATSRDELIRGAVAVAAPFFGSNGRVLGSLAVFGPTVRLSQERINAIAAQLVEGARDLSRALGNY